MTIRTLLIAGSAALAVSACTTDDWNAIAAGMAQGLAEANYDAQYGYRGYNSYGYGNTGGYYGSYYAPYNFNSYSGWPSAYSYGQWVGYGQCSNTGSFYTCDTNYDGYADMFGNTDDGSYYSSHLRVNGRGEAFTWDSDCACWERDRSFDGPRRRYHSRWDDY